MHCAPDLGSVPPEEGPVDGDEARKQHHALLFKRTTSVPHNISRYRQVLGRTLAAVARVRGKGSLCAVWR